MPTTTTTISGVRMGVACNVLPRNGLHVIRCVLGQIEVAGGGGPARLDWLRFTVTLQVTHVVSAAAMGRRAPGFRADFRH